MSVVSATFAGRSAAEALMQDSCTISTLAASSTFDPETGQNVPAAETLVYDGPCRIQIQQPQPMTPDGMGHRWTVQEHLVQIPVSAPTPPVGSVVEITDCPTDPANVGRRFTVVGHFRKSHATAQRITVQEVVE